MITTQNNNIYIVTYHYVREIKKSKFPNINGLEFKEFKKQINYFIKNFNILNNDQFCEVLINKNKISKKKSVLLTFDDGYYDHYKYVFPYLNEKKISGIFYPPINIIKNNSMLDVNKIHFILEREQNRKKILKMIFDLFKMYKKKKISIDFNKINFNNSWDDKDTILIKNLLQFYIPEPIKKKILNKIFERIVKKKIEQFSKKVYMNKSQIIEMHANSMTFGSHGCSHSWFEYLSAKKQNEEIKNSINYFKSIKVYDKNFSFCYPYGSYNQTSINLLKKNKVKFALTTINGPVNKANIKSNYILPRIDTNDFK